MSLASISSYKTVKTSPPLLVSDVVSSNFRSTKILLDSIQGSNSPWIIPVKACTTELINLKEAPTTIDGVTLQYNDRILVKDQISNQTNLNDYLNNGIYIVNTPCTRANDLIVGSSLVGIIVYVCEGQINGNTFFYCTNSFSDSVGSSILTFVPIYGLANGSLGSIQYNLPSGYFSGSDLFTFVVDGNYRTLSVNNVNLGLSSNTNSVSANITGDSGQVIFETGIRGDSQNTTNYTHDGNILLGCTFCDLFIASGQTSSGTSSGNISFTTGYNGGSISLISGSSIGSYISLSSESYIDFITSGKTLRIENGGVTLAKGTVTAANLIVQPQLNTLQGIVTITDPSTLGANSSASFVVLNNLVKTDSLIFVNINSYSGTGSPCVEVISKTVGTSFTAQISNISSTGLSNTTLELAYIIL
jgi:hypothetical protein